MPGIIPPGEGISELQKGYDWGATTGTTTTGGGFARPVQSAKGWDDLNRAVAVSLPTALAYAGMYQHAALSVLRRRSRVKR